MFSGRLKDVATGNFLNGVQFCESPELPFDGPELHMLCCLEIDRFR